MENRRQGGRKGVSEDGVRISGLFPTAREPRDPCHVILVLLVLLVLVPLPVTACYRRAIW